MKNEILSYFLSFLGIALSFLVIIGWANDINALKSIMPFWVTMKFTTAICFFMCSLSIFLTIPILNGAGDFLVTIVSLLNFIVILLVLVIILSAIFGVVTGVENLIIQESGSPILTSVPGRPSLGTVISFLFISVSNMFVLLGKKCNRFVFLLSYIVLFISALAVFGYFLNIPQFYYAIGKLSTAMAFHTAIIFVLLSLAMINLLKVLVEKSNE